MMKYLAALIAGIAALLGLYAFTLWSVYFAGGRSEISAIADGEPVSLTPLKDGFFMLQGAGGNITVSVGEDGVLLVDSGYERVSEAVLGALSGVSQSDVLMILNTHAHRDHAEGNAALRKVGTEIVAQENARDAIAADEGRGEGAVPDTAFDGEHVLRFNGHTIRLYHAPSAHTDGDAIVHFEEANVISAGDVFNTAALPYLSLRSGASLDGHLAGQVLMMGLADEDTILVPGHGEAGGLDDLRSINAALQAMRDRLAWAKNAGLPRKLRVLIHPVRGLPDEMELEGDWENYWTSLVWDALP